eukprot:3036573-Rhodomonas_salina.2
MLCEAAMLCEACRRQRQPTCPTWVQHAAARGSQRDRADALLRDRADALLRDRADALRGRAGRDPSR